MSGFINLTGQRFGRLIASNREGRQGTYAMWLCKCDCGKTKVISGHHLRCGHTKSCGCLQSENAIRLFTKHGLWKKPEYKLWKEASRRAIKFNLPFNIEPIDISIPEYCPILGIKLGKIGIKQANHSPSLDKIQPKLGYVKGNIGVISMRANRMKQDATIGELYKIIEYIKRN